MVTTDETKSASEMDKTLPDINPPRIITRSARKESKGKTTDVNDINSHTTRSNLSEDSATENDKKAVSKSR